MEIKPSPLQPLKDELERRKNEPTYILGTECEPSLFQPIINEMTRKPLNINLFRKNSGVGQSQVFGICKQRNSRYCGSSMNYKRPELYRLLIQLGEKILPPDFSYSAIQVNQNYQTAPHKDKGNRGLSAIIGFGDYEKGELVVSGEEVDIKHRVLLFNGCKHLHSTKPFTGNRFSLVYHTPDRNFVEIPKYDFTAEGNLIETMNGVKRVFNKKADVLEGPAVVREARRPYMSFCTEPTACKAAGSRQTATQSSEPAKV